ncbi:replication protein RepA [Alishewanella tabrizica]|uniref:replication protein RepA n=1 Tax=Alishewanella tabrizica TaxID=671278 RepID=UPI00167BA2ED|nr:replication protein RepA [Alishewanella tabrizica]
MPSNKPSFTADAFIDDAHNYALGLPQIVSLRPLLAAEDDTVKLPMRHATFTLSEEAITALSELSALTGEPKSKLIRKLILRATQAVQIDLAQVRAKKPERK